MSRIQSLTSLIKEVIKEELGNAKENILNENFKNFPRLGDLSLVIRTGFTFKKQVSSINDLRVGLKYAVAVSNKNWEYVPFELFKIPADNEDTNELYSFIEINGNGIKYFPIYEIEEFIVRDRIWLIS